MEKALRAKMASRLKFFFGDRNGMSGGNEVVSLGAIEWN